MNFEAMTAVETFRTVGGGVLAVAALCFLVREIACWVIDRADERAARRRWED